MLNSKDRAILLTAGSKRPHYCEVLDNSWIIMTNEVSSCGDQLSFGLEISGQQIISCHFSGLGCLLSYAAAEIILATIEQQTISQAWKIVNDLIGVFQANKNHFTIMKSLWPISVFSHHQVRRNCVLISALTIKRILQNFCDE